MHSLHKTKKTASYPLYSLLNNTQIFIYFLQMPKIQFQNPVVIF